MTPGSSRNDRMDDLEKRLREEAPAWRAAALARRPSAKPQAAGASPLARVGLLVAIAAAVLIFGVIGLYAPVGPTGAHRSPPMVTAPPPTRVLDAPAKAIERPLNSEAQLLAMDVRRAATAALGPLRPFAAPPRHLTP